MAAPANAKLHSKYSVTSLNGSTITAMITNKQVERNSDKHDVTVHGEDDHSFAGGLGNGAMSISGIYDTTSAKNPQDVIMPLIGTLVTFIHYPQGIGSGLPQNTMSVLVEKYVETAPVADMVTWSADLQPSGAWTTTDQ